MVKRPMRRDKALVSDLKTVLRIMKQNRRNRAFWLAFRPELLRLKRVVDDAIEEGFGEPRHG